MLSYLRIALTGLSLTAFVLVIVLWARSHRTLDLLELYCGYGYGGHIGSACGGMEFCVSIGKTDFPNAKPGINYKAISNKQMGVAKPGFNAITGVPGVYFLQMPDWFLISVAAILAVAPWVRRRYSLRALLIGTTLIASLLGIFTLAS